MAHLMRLGRIRTPIQLLMLVSEDNCFKLPSFDVDLGVIILKAIARNILHKLRSLSINRESESGVIGLHERLLAKLHKFCRSLPSRSKPLKAVHPHPTPNHYLCIRAAKETIILLDGIIHWESWIWNKLPSTLQPRRQSKVARLCPSKAPKGKADKAKMSKSPPKAQMKNQFYNLGFLNPKSADPPIGIHECLMYFIVSRQLNYY